MYSKIGNTENKSFFLINYFANTSVSLAYRSYSKVQVLDLPTLPVFSLFSQLPSKDLKSPIFFKNQTRSEKKGKFYFYPLLLCSTTCSSCLFLTQSLQDFDHNLNCVIFCLVFVFSFIPTSSFYQELIARQIFQLSQMTGRPLI